MFDVRREPWCRAGILALLFSIACFGGHSRDLHSASDSLSFSSYLGGTGTDMIRDVTFGPDGAIYVAGGTDSADYPTTPGAFDRSAGGSFDVFVAKFNPSGELVWSTLVGGPNYDRAYALEVDALGYVYIAGRAGPGYPTTPGVVQERFGGDVNPSSAYGPQDGFVTKIKPDGSGLVWSTFFGSDDKEYIRDLDIDSAGAAYLGVTAIGRAHPHITPGVFQPTLAGGTDHVVAKLSPDGQRVEYASYLGGSGDDGWPPTIRVDDQGSAYFLGSTFSDDLPVTPNAFQLKHGGDVDMFLAKISPAGDRLIYSSYFGGSSQDGCETHCLSVDRDGVAYITATTRSTDMPVTPGAYQTYHAGSGPVNSNDNGDAILAKVSADGSRLLACSYFGGSQGEGSEGSFVDQFGNVYVSGTTYSIDLPTTANAVQDESAGLADVWIAKFSGDLSQLLFSTYLGGTDYDFGRGLDVGPSGSIAVGGLTRSTDWPTVLPWQAAVEGNWDAMISRIGSALVFSDDFESGDASNWTFID